MAVCFVVLVAAGCNTSTETNGKESSTGATTPSSATANPGKKILADMAAAYRAAPAYRDRGQLKLTIRGHGEPHVETFPFAVDFIRPNKLRIEAYSSTLASDGKTVVGKHASPANNDFEGQMLVLDAPPQITAADVAQFDAALQRGLSGMNSWPFTLALLLLGDQIEQQFSAADRVVVLPARTLEGRDCHVVQIEDDDGHSIWWIDKQDSLLRRFEYSVNGVARMLNLNPSEVSLVADFADASFATPADERFTLAIEDDAERVKFLVPPPILPPAKLVGEPAPAFAFDLFAGKDFAEKTAGKLTADSLRGKATTLLITSINDTQTLAAFEGLAKRFKDRGETAFVAVLTESPAALPDAQFRAVMTQRAPTYSVARATNATAAFSLLAPSAVVFLGKEGLVEDAIPLDTLPAIQAAPEILETLLADKPWHPRALGRIENDRRVYAEQLVLAKTGKIAAAEAAPQAPPKEHRIVSLWKQAELKDPGNIVAGATDTGAFLVLDGPRTVVELDARGQIARRHELNLPSGGEIGFLRAGRTQAGKRFFAGSRLFLPKVYIFDDNWNVTASYPDGPIPASEDNPAVGDVQVADLDGNGDDEILVGYRGIHGVHLLSRDGRRRWTNRAVFEVSRLAVAPGEDGHPAMLVGSIEAPTAVIDAHGKDRGRWPAESGPLVVIAISPPLAASPSAGPAAGSARAYLGIAHVGANQFAAVGFAPSGQPLGQYPLPPGLPATQIEAVAWGRVVGDADHWTIAAPDGSIHFLSADGRPLDHFALGILPTGIAATTIDGQPALVVSKKNAGVEALRFEKAEAIQPAE